MTTEEQTTQLMKNLNTWSLGIIQIATDIGIQLDGVEQNRFSKFYLGILKRQVIVLTDIHVVLTTTPANQITTAFILFRCLLDDFILLLYIESKGFDEEVINKHEAKSYSNHYSAMRESKEMNVKYHEGKRKGMYTQATYDKSFNDFRNREGNEIYFSDAGRETFKPFPNTRDLIVNLPENEASSANAHAFIIWKYLSSYVHYSATISTPAEAIEFRLFELKQLQEALSYCYKGIHLISDVLRDVYGLNHTFNDPQHIFESVNGNQ